MRILLKLAYVVVLGIALIGALNVALHGVLLWMMLSGQVQPGGPMFIDAVAPDSVRNVYISLMVGLVPMGLALFGCWKIRQRLTSPAKK